MAAKFVITDPIVSDSIGAIASVPADISRPAVTGGMAIQLYVADSMPYLERPTTDIDLLTEVRPTAKTFKEGLGSHLMRCLMAYAPEYGKTAHSFEVGLKDAENYPFFLHTYRQNGGYSFPSAACVKRQVSNANTIGHKEGKIQVVRVEDIIARKLRRLDAYNEHDRIPERHRKSYRDLQNERWERLAEAELAEWLGNLTRDKAMLPAFLDQGEEDFRKKMAEYTISKDLFDISVLAKLVAGRAAGFDEKYYQSAVDANKTGQ